MQKKFKKKGAQPGNQEAIQHGLYSNKFHPSEIQLLESALADNLTDEIAMLRVVLRRLFELSAEEQDVGKLIKSVSTLGAAATRLAGLMRTQSLIQGSGASSMDVLSEALKEVSDELGLK